MAASSRQYGVCMTEAMTELALFELLSLECRVDEYGTVRYYNALGNIHREHGPAIEYADGTHVWFQNGQPHRVDGPAVEGGDGYRAWCINGEELTQAEWQQAVASMETV
jgi:hypothetical protein